VFIGAPMAQAAADEIVVTNLDLSGPGSFRSAVEAANASTNPDGVSIVFAESLAGSGPLALTGGADNSMQTTQVGNPAGNLAGAIGPAGARFVIDSTVPVSVDFTNLDGITDVDGSAAAGIYVKSDGVSLSHLAGLRAAEAGIAVSGTGTTIEDVTIADPDTNWQEVGIALLDGATNTSILGSTIYSPLFTSIGVEQDAVVTGTYIDGLTSRGVESWGHIDIEDGATVDGFTVVNSTLGSPEETSPTHGFYLNPNITATGLTLQNSTVQSWARNGLFFEGGGQSFTDTVIDGNTFGGNEGREISRVIGDNTAEWTGLDFTDNDISFAGAVMFSGTVTDAVFSGNDFTDVTDGAYPTLGLGNVTENVTVENNTFNRLNTNDVIRVSGTSATDVQIVGNDIRNLIFGASRTAVRIYTGGEGNVVGGNTLVQEIDDTSLRSDIDNHWAIYNSANAATVDDQVGWSFVGNTIDGFGGKDRSQAPVVHAGRGKLPVVGNTFGLNTRGGLGVNVEESGYFFLWNVYDGSSNNTVQTYRVGDLAYDGTNATFTAVEPDPVIGNRAAVGPVTLYVYWTSADNAEEYLGSIEDVNAGDSVSIATTHTDGFLRLQTVDANGFTSQYSSIDPDAVVELPAPVVVEVTPEEVTGTGDPSAQVVIRDENGDDVTTADVDELGNWTVPASELECGTTYTAVQIVGDEESEPTEFTTADCPAPPADPTEIVIDDDGVSGSAEPLAHIIVRDADGNEVATTEADENGDWSVPADLLTCGTTYSVVQVVDGVESDPTPFVTADCPASGDDDSNGTGNGSGSGDGDLATTGGELAPGIVWSGIALLLLGLGLTAARRRRARI